MNGSSGEHEEFLGPPKINMSDRSRKPWPNPFYVILLLVSTVFVVTALGYLIGPFVQQQAKEHPTGGPGPASRAVAEWLDRRAPLALSVEIGLMLASGVLAMATEHRFSRKRAKGPR
jgi:predicted PurR-regulated permease PerM